MRNVLELASRVAAHATTVLLTGESGTGKEVLARAIHQLSPRRDAAFTAINCAAIPEQLLESELFGHLKGSFTGATADRAGLFEASHGGTLLLDEIGDMPISLQSKLLRFFEERSVERIGGRELIPVDVRIVCATHQDLPTLIREGRFREDLFYRVSEVTIRLPPVRERAGDVAALAQFFLEQSAKRHGRHVRGFTAKALRAIEACPWRGNVRELENAVNSAVIMADGRQIGPDELHLGVVGKDILDLRQVRNDAEKHAIQIALTQSGGNL